MKIFAIIPEKFDADRIINSLPGLISSGVNYLYLRGIINSDEISRLAKEINRTDIIPVLSNKVVPENLEYTYGIHYKSTEIDLASEKKTGCAILTAAAHNQETAKHLLEKGVDYVYISPVYSPLSKAGDNRPLFPIEHIKSLTNAFEERVVLLGGITMDRIRELKKTIENDFSIAGITLFFNQP